MKERNSKVCDRIKAVLLSSEGWIRKGVEKMIATVAGRSRVNLTGAIDLESMSIFTQEYKTIDGEATIDFLKYLDNSKGCS